MSTRWQLSQEDIAKVEAILKEACGIRLIAGLRVTLQLSFDRAAAMAGVAPTVYLDRLVRADPESIASLVENSVIGETYFARSPEHFVALKRVILPSLNPAEALRVWSAGCSSGEEPYGLAMTLMEAGRAAKRDRVVGTDISHRALEKARHGLYTRWSLRTNHPGLDRWVTSTPQGFQVQEELRQRVEFLQANLLTDAPPMRDCHVIFCRNVLIYFEPRTISAVLQKFSAALAVGGYLVLGAAELPYAVDIGLSIVETEGVTLLRRPLEPIPPAPVEPARAEPRPPAPLPRRSAPSPVSVATPAPAPPRPSAPTLFDRARAAARDGTLEEAEKLAHEAALHELRPEAYLLLSMAAESRDDLDGAVAHVRRALYLDPSLAIAHATLVTLYQRLGKPHEAERSRRNALQALGRLREEDLLAGVEVITAGALRQALEGNTPGRE